MAGNKIKAQNNDRKLSAVHAVVAVLMLPMALSFGACATSESNTNTTAVNRGPNLSAPNATTTNSFVANVNAANVFNANANRPMDAQMQKLEEMRKAANRSGKAIPSLNSRPAPEDSTMTATLTDFARETRTWKKHPTLAKVEKVHDGGEGAIKVYLRNGKVIDLPGKAIAQLDQIPAASVLQLAGVSSASTPEQKQPSRRQEK
jgi:hypothetical protein